MFAAASSTFMHHLLKLINYLNDKCLRCAFHSCTLFWKAFAIVLALWTAFGIFKLAKWALTVSFVAVYIRLGIVSISLRM